MSEPDEEYSNSPTQKLTMRVSKGPRSSQALFALVAKPPVPNPANAPIAPVAPPCGKPGYATPLFSPPANDPVVPATPTLTPAGPPQKTPIAALPVDPAP